MDDTSMRTDRLCVIIPVHKPNMSVDDVISLKACSAHLSNYDCYIVFPNGMNIDEYKSVYPSLKLKPVNPDWLSSIENYNRMKTDVAFYQMFSDYQFMLTYELDAYIFSSELEKYKIFDFDYIGAPLFEGYLQALPDAQYTMGFNSGFSVRNIQACLKVFDKLKSYGLQWFIYENIISKLPRRIHNFFVFRVNKFTSNRYEMILNGQLSFYFKKKAIWEDIVWSVIVPSLFPFFKVADHSTAAGFSIEALPARLLKMNGDRLPLGCHGWPKNKDFWKNYIDIKE